MAKEKKTPTTKSELFENHLWVIRNFVPGIRFVVLLSELDNPPPRYPIENGHLIFESVVENPDGALEALLYIETVPKFIVDTVEREGESYAKFDFLRMDSNVPDELDVVILYQKGDCIALSIRKLQTIINTSGAFHKLRFEGKEIWSETDINHLWDSLDIPDEASPDWYREKIENFFANQIYTIRYGEPKKPDHTLEGANTVFAWEVNKENRTVSCNDGKPVKLPPRLFNLFYYLYTHPVKNIDLGTLFRTGWEYKEEKPNYKRTVQDGINDLRDKLQDTQLSKEKLKLIIKAIKKGKEITHIIFNKQITI